MKNKRDSSSKLFMCFRPAVIEEVDDSDEQVLTYVTVGKGNIDGLVIPKMLTSLSSDDHKFKESSDGIDVRNKSAHRSFSRFVKDVFFDKYLYRKNSFRSNSNQSSKSEKISNSIRKKRSSKQSSDAEEMLRINSSGSSSLFSSSTTTTTSTTSLSFTSSYTSSSSIASTSQSLLERKGSFNANSDDLNQRFKQVSTTKKISGSYYKYSSNVGLYLILMCLLVVICWGKICAILCLSTWLFFAPTRVESPGNEIDLTDFDSEEYKKRVIMEGLLERNRNRVL